MRKLIGPIAAMALLLVLALPATAAEKVTLCHATNSASNPFVAIEIDLSGNAEGHKADDGNFHVNAKTGLQDFLLAGQETCDAGDLPVTPLAVAALAPSVSAGTCVAPGVLTLNAVTGVTYSVSPAYTAGASGSFTVTATAASGFTLTGPTIFVVNVPAQVVCSSGTLSGTTPVAPTTPVRQGTLAGSGGPVVPNTATNPPMDQLPVLLGALLTIGSLGYLGLRSLVGGMGVVGYGKIAGARRRR